MALACSSEDGGVAQNDPTGGTGGGGSGGSSATGGQSASGGSGGTITTDSGPDPNQDTDGDGIPDVDEGSGDADGDGKPNYDDPINDGEPSAITLTSISTTFNSPIGIDYHQPSNTVVMSVNYPTGTPAGFEKIAQDGTHQQFSTLSGLTEEVKIATARPGNPGGFTPGDLFVGNGIDGQIARITQDGASVINPWVDLPGDNNGLMRGSLYVDRTGVFGGDLMVVTSVGEVWRITAAAVPTLLTTVAATHLEGALVVPDKPARFGPIAGKLIAGAEEANLLYAFATDGTYVTYNVGVAVEDIDIVSAKENFFGVNFGTGQLLGAGAEQWETMMGDVLLTQEIVTAGTSGLFRLKFDGTTLVAQPIPLSAAQTATVGQWEHVTFAAAGIKEIPPVQ